jgi:uroporphyrinogen-III decarboxylase
MKWHREQYLDYMTFGAAPRPMFVELFGPLLGLEDEWRAQGASEEEINLTAFEFDYVPIVWAGGSGPRRTPPVLISENDEERIERDYLGRTIKLCKNAATISLPMDFPVKTMDDWLKLKPLFLDGDWRINPELIAKARLARDEDGAIVVASIPGAFDTVRELMGEELGCLAYYDEPELMADILTTLRDTSTRVLDRLSKEVQIDQLSVHEDFAGRSGPLVGPGHILEHFKPYYLAAWEIARSAGARIFQLDTDGNINSVMDALLECGLTSMHPMEPAAGMDIVQVREKYGNRVALLGGIDKHVLRQDKSAIRAELEYKLQAKMRQGGTVFSLDHRIPNGTPLDHYRYYVDTAREILDLPPRRGKEKGWQRMAS